HFVDRDGGGLELLCSQPVTGDVDDVVDPAEDAEVTVSGLDGAVTGEVRPVVPVLAVLVLAVLLVVDVDEPLRVSPKGLEDARPGIADADVARATAPGFHDVALLVVDGRVDAEHTRTAAARLHGLRRRQRAAEAATILRLPQRIDEHGVTLGDGAVVPPPNCATGRLHH